jgi:thiamine biosynthesis protein ThiS
LTRPESGHTIAALPLPTRPGRNPVIITLNGDRYEVPASTTTVSELLRRLNIDPHRVAVERNLVVLKRAAFDTTPIADGDQIEVVNFVGGGEPGI